MRKRIHTNKCSTFGANLLFEIPSSQPSSNKSCTIWFKVAFSRDGTSRCPFVPGQINFLVPVSLCPGTRAGANVPGQTPLSRDVPGQNELKNFKKNFFLANFGHFLAIFWPFCPAGRPGTEGFVPEHLLMPLSRDKWTAGQAKLFCLETKRQRDKEFFLSRDKGTTGRPGLSCGTSRPVETLVSTTLKL